MLRWLPTPLAALPLLLATSASAQDLVLTNANIVDPLSRTITRGALWIENGRIVGRGRKAPAQARGERIDLAGRWVVPGFVDAHAHSFGNIAPHRRIEFLGPDGVAKRVVRAGVTAYLDLFSAEDNILRARDAQRASADSGAEIFAAGPCFTATGGHCSEYGVPTRLIDTPDDARRQLAELAPKKPDVIKVVYDHFAYSRPLPTVDRPTFEALIAAAKEHGLRTVVHVGTWEDVRHAALAGATAVTHVPFDEVAPDDVIALLKERGIYHIPTLAVVTDLAAMVADSTLSGAPLLAALTRDSLRVVYGRGEAGLDSLSLRWARRQQSLRANVLESVRRLDSAGVRMLAGTDAGNLGILHGYSLHREMFWLVEAGLTPWEALAAATTSAGAFLGRDFGVRPGDDANLVVLGASPIENIANTQRIDLLVMRGRVVHR
jgi:imidazolonepropionase-like amidohydrolase